MTRTIWHWLAWGLLVATITSFFVFALYGTHPAWMMATFWFALGTVISTALAISSP